jgi:glycine oxidase
MTADVLIVGGGIIGLSIAYVLAGEGVRCIVVDRGPLGRAASWAGAGIIAPAANKHADDPLSALRTLSARLHEDWAARLKAETGIDNGYRLCGGLDIVFDAEEDVELLPYVERWRDEGIAFERLDGDALKRLEPNLSVEVISGYLLPGRAQIRNPRHMQALANACERKGVTLLPGREVTNLRCDAGRVVAVETTGGVIRCGWVVLSAGPWTESLARSIAIDLVTPPVKGQIVLFQSEPRLLSRIIEHGSKYLVPRDDGHILMGATEENAGFDLRPTAAAERDLIAHAFRLLPALQSAQIITTWTGLRPGNLDGLPTIGLSPSHENVVLATGHRRAGLQLSPGTAEVVAELILGRPQRLDLQPFRPGRPPAAPAADLFRS